MIQARLVEVRERSQGRWLGRARLVALGLVLLLSSAKMLAVVHEHYPIQHWLFWRYASYWQLAGVFVLSAFLSGGALSGLLRLCMPRLERWLVSFALGLYLWFIAMFLVGLVGWLTPAFAVVLPLGLCLAGAPRAVRRGRRLWPVYRRALGGGFSVRASSVLLGAAALLGLALIYVPTTTPDNIAADAYWYHLTLAQHNAAQAAITRSAEGSFVATYPQLATTLYTWAFILPRTAHFDRIEIAAHLELAIFLWTLVGVGVAAARVIPRRRAGFTWAAILLFPGLYLYDSGLSVAADHVLAFWGPPIFLALLRAWRSLEPRWCLLTGVMLAGAALTKYQAGTLVVLPVLALGLRGAFLAARGRRLAPLGGLAIAGAVTLACFAPHWLKNWVWYGDPFYPMLHARLRLSPWSPDAETYMNAVFAEAFWRPQGTLGEKLLATGKALFTFSLIPNDWPGFHGSVPVFGSLFTFTSLCLPFMRAHRRLWALTGLTYGGIFFWYWISHQDRYLQALVPWMAAVTGATLVLLWRSGLFVRIALGVLVLVQVAWGSDVPFIPTHALINTTPYQKVLELAATGYRKNYFERLRPFPWWFEMAPQIPKDGKVLIHGDLGPLGLRRAVVSDMLGWQGGLSYGRHKSAAELHQLLRSYGVTHVVWLPDQSSRKNSIADDLVFYSFVNLHLVDRWSTGNHQLGRLAEQGPRPGPYGMVLVWGHGTAYQNGLHRVDMLTVPGFLPLQTTKFPEPLKRGAASELVGEAEFVVLFQNAPEPPALEGFTLVMSRGDHQIWARSRGSR